MDTSCWQTQDQFLEMKTQWLTLIGEHLIDTQEQTLEYWRIEKADSVIVLPMFNDQLLLPLPSYRPGIKESTWDFPGGRVPEGKTPEEAIPSILKRELGISENEIATIKPLNASGWTINSSFSNQCVYGFVVEVKSETELSPVLIGKQFSADSSGIQAGLTLLNCLQCRAVLMEWWLTTAKGRLQFT